MPAISAPIASERPSSFAAAAIPITSAKAKRRKNSLGRRSSSLSIVRAEEARRRHGHRHEPQRLRESDEGRTDAVPTGRREAEHARDDDVLEDQDGEDEVGLVVGEAAEVDQPLHDHGTRRDVDTGREDERREAEAECRDPDEQAEAGVEDQVDRAADPEMATAAREPVVAELEPEEEEQEDDPELGDELRHLGRLDQAEDLRLVRPEQEAGKDVGGDCREPEAPGREAQHGEHRHGYRELREGQVSTSARMLWAAGRLPSLTGP